MAETDQGRIAQVRVGEVEARLAEADRLAGVEARLAEHHAMLMERQRAEEQAQTERQLAATAVKQALQDAAKSQAESLVAALESADKLESERIARVKDEVEGVKSASTAKAELQRRAQDKFEAMVAGEFKKMNEIRGALEDLGKGMATRRDLESAVQALEAAGDERSKQIAELRTAVAVGPKGLPELKEHTDQSIGEQRLFLREKREVMAAQNRQIALVGAIAAVLTVIVYVIIATHG
jgi:chromosome segregation ATPase